LHTSWRKEHDNVRKSVVYSRCKKKKAGTTGVIDKVNGSLTQTHSETKISRNTVNQASMANQQEATIDHDEQIEDVEDDSQEDEEEHARGEQEPQPEAPRRQIVIPETIFNSCTEYMDLGRQIKDAQKEVKAFMEQLRVYKEPLKILKDRKMELETLIQEFMEKNMIPWFETRSGRIELTEARAKAPLNKEYLHEAMATKIQDAKMLDDLCELAFNRPSSVVRKVKVVNNKK
jgi:hypothetical protein